MEMAQAVYWAQDSELVAVAEVLSQESEMELAQELALGLVQVMAQASVEAKDTAEALVVAMALVRRLGQDQVWAAVRARV